MIAIDYFTKWVEAKPLVNIRDQDVKRFFWRNIVTRFGVSNTLISNNGLQFDSKAFWRYCCDLGIKKRYSTPSYPQSNGQAEATNKVIVDGLKKRLEDTKGKWVDELPHILWTYRTTPRRSIGKTPFSMTYRSEAVISTKTGFPTLRSNQLLGGRNERLLSFDLNLVEERREIVAVRLAQYKQQLR